jgi:DNA replication protein DnaC
VNPYEQLKADLDYLQLHRVAECFATISDEAKANDWSHVEYLARVIAEQATSTTNRRLAARLRYARFPYRRSIAEFDFDFQPSVDRKLVEDLASLRFVKEGRNIVLLGQPGVG